jgi:hypothetical protein
MKQKASPVAIGVAAVALIVLLTLMYRFFFPPMPPPDTANPNGMPAYAKEFLKNRKARGSSAGAQPGGTIPGH